LTERDSIKPYSKELVEVEAWLSCLGAPIVVGGELIGAISLYTRSHSVNLNQLLPLEPVVLLGAGILVHHERGLKADKDRSILIDQRLERMQSGVELLGFVHDLAHEAQGLAERAQEIVDSFSSRSQSPALERVTEEMRDRAEVVAETVRSMNRLAEGRRPEVTRFDVKKTIDDVIRVITAMSGDVDISIPEGLHVRGDPLDLQRIIVNLISNAKHWTGVNSRKITVHARSLGGSVELEVQDNGPGMSEKVRRQAMNPFYSRRTGGLGLGLYVVKLLVERLRGEVQIQSVEGEGTTVQVLLPIAAPPRERDTGGGGHVRS